MGKIQINRVTNANVYMDGNNLLGRAEEINLPMIKHKMTEHKALGMIGSAEFFSGIDKLECKIKWNSLYPDVLKKAANPFKTIQIQARASLETYNSQGKIQEVPAVAYLSGTFKEFPLGNIKAGDNAEYETTMAINYAKLIVAGEELFEIDILENIYKVGGIDIMQDYRNNIGG